MSKNTHLKFAIMSFALGTPLIALNLIAGNGLMGFLGALCGSVLIGLGAMDFYMYWNHDDRT